MRHFMPEVTEAIKHRLPILESRGVIDVLEYHDIRWW
jgi:hypothetical protein